MNTVNVYSFFHSSKAFQVATKRTVSALTMVAMVFGSFSPLVAFPISAAAVAPVSIFSDGFEVTPAFSSPSWTAASPWGTDSSDSHGGSKQAKVVGTGSGTKTLETGIDTSGYDSLTYSFWYKLDGLDSGDSLTVEWYDGSTWQTLTTFNGVDGTGDDSADWTEYSSALPVGAEDNADFAVRFVSDMNTGSDTFSLDDVDLSGLAIPVTDITAPSLPTHLSPADGSTLSSAALTDIDWTDVTDPSSPVTYYYQSSHSSATNIDGSFVTPVYNSGALSASHIPASGTPNGVYYWHVRAVDNVGNSSDWTSAWSITVADTPACSLDDTTFDTFSLGNVNGQNSWSSTGAYDQSIVNNTYGYSTFGCKSLRLSNAVTSGSFGDQTFSYSNANEAGEVSAENGGFSGGSRQNHFEAQWDFASTNPGAEQPGLNVTVSPDRGDGARMSWIQMADTSSGLEVNFYDYAVGNTVDDGPCDCAPFRYTTIASGLDRTIPHTIKVTMDFVNGSENDVVKVYVDGSLVHTGTSWEDYFRSEEGNPTRTVDSLLFRASGTAAPANSGNGFLFDNMSLSSHLLSLVRSR